MNTIVLRGLSAADPMGYLASVGVLRVLSRSVEQVRLGWIRDGGFWANLHSPVPLDVIGSLMADLERWRAGHPALDFAVGAERKVQDLKQTPDEFRRLMRQVRGHPEAAAFVAAYATGVATDRSGKQGKPTAFHFTAGKQRFLDAILSLRSEVTEEDLREALYGPWVGRPGPKDPRWRAASERSRALLSYDPSKVPNVTVAGAAWLAFQALPLFPVVPRGLRVVTTGFVRRDGAERFIWPVWESPLTLEEVRTLVGLPGLAEMSARERTGRGIVAVLASRVTRSSQGYGNFAASEPVPPGGGATREPA